MNSRLTEDFVACFRRLPSEIQRLARKNYRLWKANAAHPGLRFNRVHLKEPIYSVRVGIDYRALGLLDGNTITWFWIGPHAEYERIIGGQLSEHGRQRMRHPPLCQ